MRRRRICRESFNPGLDTMAHSVDDGGSFRGACGLHDPASPPEEGKMPKIEHSFLPSLAHIVSSMRAYAHVVILLEFYESAL